MAAGKSYRAVKINPDRFHKSQIKFFIIILPVLAFMMLPIIYIGFHAFKPMDELFAFPPKFITLRPSLENFKRLFAVAGSTNYPASVYLFNSAVTTFLTVVCSVLICAASAYALSKKEFAAKKIIMTVNQVALMFVPVAVSVPRYLVIKHIGLLDNYAASILPLLAMPVGLFLVKVFVDQIPDSLVEAARIDGASEYYILLKIVIPIITPALATVAILAFQASWNSVEASQMFLDNEKMKTFAYYMTTVTSATGNNVAGQGMGAAATLIMFVPNLVLFVIMQSRIMNTVAHSGIK